MNKDTLIPEDILIEHNPSHVLKHLNSSESGLPPNEAATRLKFYGPNALPESKGNDLLTIIFRQFINVLVAILLIAAVVSILIGEYSQGIIIGLVVIINAVIGASQEYRAETALKSFGKLLPKQAKVKRGGETVLINAEMLTVGDVVQLTAGDVVPADMRLISDTGLEVNESILTGESDPKQKYSHEIKSKQHSLNSLSNMVFSGTHVVKGEALGVISAVGNDSVIGKIASVAHATRPPETVLFKQIRQIGIFSGYVAVAISIFILILSLLTDKPLVDTVFLITSIAVSIVPEGLAATVSVTLALGALNLVRKKAIIKKLGAMTTLGSVSVICTDKTGTITKNEIEFEKSLLVGNSSQINSCRKWLDNSCALCNSLLEIHGRIVGDAVDLALYNSLTHKQVSRIKKDYDKLAELPFDGERKMMSVIVEDKYGKIWCLSKGAFKSISNHSISSKSLTEKEAAIEEWASAGFKTIVVAYKELSRADWIKYQDNPENYVDQIENDLIPIAAIALADPPRSGTQHAIAEAFEAGINTIMVTGDWSLTAIKISKEVGLIDGEYTNISGRQLANIDIATLSKSLKNNPHTIFTEIDPTQKSKIVTALQGLGHIVAMTGDGVNDAPALKQADVGIAMGRSGTAVAREAADVVLQNDAYTSIIAAVREGRIIYNNIRKFIFYEFGFVAAQILVVILSLVLGLPHILLPMHVVIIDMWIGLLPSMALGVDPANPKIMTHQADQFQENLLTPQICWRILRTASIVAVGAVLAYLFSADSTYSSTVVYATISLSYLGLALQARSNKRKLHELIIKPNIYLNYACLASLLFLLFTIYFAPLGNIIHTYPLALYQWLIPFATMLSAVLIDDITKPGIATEKDI